MSTKVNYGYERRGPASAKIDGVAGLRMEAGDLGFGPWDKGVSR